MFLTEIKVIDLVEFLSEVVKSMRYNEKREKKKELKLIMEIEWMGPFVNNKTQYRQFSNGLRKTYSNNNRVLNGLFHFPFSFFKVLFPPFFHFCEKLERGSFKHKSHFVNLKELDLLYTMQVVS